MISSITMRWTPLLVVMLLALGVTHRAHAQQQPPSVDRLSQNLRDSDFRVRTQAALALGASKAVQAVTPLCGALGDPNTTVRTAAAAALGRLSMGGTQCLEKRLAIETVANVKSAIQKALELIAEPKIGPETRFYVAIAKLTDKSGRAPGDLDQRVRSGMVSAGKGMRAFAFAPAAETADQAKTRVKRYPALKGFYLAPRLPAFEYANASLTIRLEIAMFSYPDRALIGNFGVRLTQPDVESKDVASENDLVQMAAERALEKFAKLAPTL